MVTKRSISDDLTGTHRNSRKILCVRDLLTRDFRLLNLFFFHNVKPTSHFPEISATQDFALQAISKNLRVDWCHVTFKSIAKFGAKKPNITSVLL